LPPIPGHTYKGHVNPRKIRDLELLRNRLGGHNDYWNRTAPDIAARLDALITA